MELDDYSQKINKDMKSINILLSQELIAQCLMRKDLASQSATMPQEQKHEQMNSLPVAASMVGGRSEHMASEENLPDTSIYIVGRYHLPWNQEECSSSVFSYMTFNFKSFSTWLPVTTMGVNLADYIDFGMVVKHNFLEPVCTQETLLHETPFDQILGVVQHDQLQYAPEVALREVLQTLGGEMDPSGVVGTRIAIALNEHPESWVLANLAALYWRMEGHSLNAVNCLRVALAHGPRQARAVSLTSLANILHHAGHLKDAIVAMAAALDVSREVVVAQFTLANIYAAKEEWTKAAQFYESALALQPTFQPASERLKAIVCQGHISQAIPAASPSL